MSTPRFPYTRAFIVLAMVGALLGAGVTRLQPWFTNDSRTDLPSRDQEQEPLGESGLVAEPDGIRGLVRTVHRSHDASTGTFTEVEKLTTWFSGENSNEWWLRHSAPASDTEHSSSGYETGSWAAEDVSWDQFARTMWHGEPCVDVQIAVPRLSGETMGECLGRLRDLEIDVAVRYVPAPVDHAGHARERAPAHVREAFTFPR